MRNSAKIEEAIHALREGRIIIVVDDEDRENEGDFIAAAETVTPETVEFMITHGRGQLCMPILPEFAARLQLGPMVDRNTAPHQTPYHRAGRSSVVPHGDQCRGAGADGSGDHRPVDTRPTTSCVPAICFRWWPRKGACSAAPGIPRRPWTWPDWPA